MKAASFFAGLALAMTLIAARADSVEMRNGDRYIGSVLSVDARLVTLQNPNLGTLRLARTNVAQISFVTTSALTATSRATPVAPLTVPPQSVVANPASLILTGTNATPGTIQRLQTEGLDPKLKEQIQAQFLSAAGPAANAKFEAMVQGLMTGAMSVDDLRHEARNAATQLREMRKHVGSEGGEMLDSYLEVLDGFIKESPGDEPERITPGKTAAPTPKTAPR